MKELTRSHILNAVMFAVLGISVLVGWFEVFPQRPIFRELPVEAQEFVRTTTDLEHLRKFTQLHIRETHKVEKLGNEVFDMLIIIIAGLTLGCSLLSVHGLARAYQAHDIAIGRPSRWWVKWL